MRIFRFIFLVILFSIGCLSAAAQILPTESQSGKEKAAQELEKNALDLLEQVAGSAVLLKLPENRAMVYATAGDLFWARNEKRARTLFRDAANEIVLANNTPLENSGAFSPAQAMLGRPEIYNLRRMVLQTLAIRDAEFALELLQLTRPADVAAEMQTYLSQTPAQVSADKLTPKLPNNYKVQQEIQLEQSLVARAAEQDPQKAAKLIRESWSKGMSYEVLSLIYKVGGKDIDLANTLLTETVQKLLDTDLSKRQNELNFSVNLLRTFATPRKDNPNNKELSKLKVDETMLKDLANRIADSLMKASGYNSYFSFSSAMPILEKVVPERAVQLKQKQTALKKQIPAGFPETPRSFSDPNAAPETLIADAAKAEPRMRGMMYRQATMRAMSSSDPEKFRSLLQSLPEGKERDDAISLLDSNIAAKLLQQGKLEEVRKIVDRMSVGNAKVEQLVGLAVASFRLNTKESKETALKFMEEARQMVNNFPEDKDETEGLIKVVAGYTVIEPDRAFGMLSPVIEQANNLINAGALLAKYNKQNQIFRNGEILMANGFASGGSKFFQYGKELKLLAQADFPRTRALIDQFSREDVRLFTKLFIAQSILKEKIGLGGAMYLSVGG